MKYKDVLLPPELIGTGHHEPDYGAWNAAADFMEERGERASAGLRVMARLKKYPEMRPCTEMHVISGIIVYPVWSWSMCWSHLGLTFAGLPLDVWVNISKYRNRMKNRHHVTWKAAIADGAVAFTKAINDGWNIEEQIELAEECKRENCTMILRVREEEVSRLAITNGQPGVHIVRSLGSSSQWTISDDDLVMAMAMDRWGGE